MAKAKDRVADVKPYVTRAIQDEELRESLRSAFSTARDVYDELIGGGGGRGAANRAASEKEIQDQPRSAIEAPRPAATGTEGKEEHRGRIPPLLRAEIALGILFTPMTGPETRRW